MDKFIKIVDELRMTRFCMKIWEQKMSVKYLYLANKLAIFAVVYP